MVLNKFMKSGWEWRLKPRFSIWVVLEQYFNFPNFFTGQVVAVPNRHAGGHPAGRGGMFRQPPLRERIGPP